MITNFVEKNRGFTFIEILVAIVLISFILVPLLTAYTNIVSSSASVSQRTKALDIAQSVADDFTYLYRHGGDIDTEINYWNNGNWRDDYSFSNKEDYDVEVNKGADDDSDGFVILTINVSWQEKGETRQVEIETLGEDN